MNGLLVIDKPGGMTSRDVVNRVQKWFSKKTKIGHTGTLDPLATGVLVVCIGAATRLADRIQAMGKTYASRFRLGATSTTDDADGEVTISSPSIRPSREAVDAALAGFVGNVSQVPPAFSALKVDGRRAHSIARRGDVVELAARTVRVDAIRVQGYEWPFVDVEVDCGKGTYIRSIARDLGAKLGCGGFVQTLRRTRVGPFAAEQGVGLDLRPEEAWAKLLPMAVAVSTMPRVAFDVDRARRFMDGQLFDASEVLPKVSVGEQIAVFDDSGRLIGVAVRREGGTVRPMVVFRS
jgi:tRNA pseudouridine55 synthase